MDVLDKSLPSDAEQLKQLLFEQQHAFKETLKTLANQNAELQNDHNTLQQQFEKQKEHVTELENALKQKTFDAEHLTSRLNALLREKWGQRSEKLANLDQLTLFNEAEHTDEASSKEDESQDADDYINVPGHKRKKRKSKLSIPDHYPRVDVVHDLEDDEKQCPHCQERMPCIGEESTELLCTVPQKKFVEVHRKKKYACSCKQCIRTSKAPLPVPGSQFSARLIADIMVSKYKFGLPLYRLEKMAALDGLILPREKLARGVIRGTETLLPLCNLLEDALFDYDIVWSDDTGIVVLNENGKRQNKQHALWIRRGGPPDKPVVLVDYAESKGSEPIYRLLQGAHGYLVSDGAACFNRAVKENGLIPVLCNDHARRRFRKALDDLPKEKARGSIAMRMMSWYGKLYGIEREAKQLSDNERLARRHQQAAPLWDEMMAFAKKKYDQGVAHTKTRQALEYLIKYETGLREYCQDARLPISNIKSEHVAKTIAIARKNFLFCQSSAGANASARAFGLIETACANGHNPWTYLSWALTEIPKAKSADDIEKLLPWAVSPKYVSDIVNSYPAP